MRLAILGIILVPHLAFAAPKYYVELRPPEDAPGLQSGLTTEARTVLEAMLKKRTDVVLAEATPLQDEELKKRGMRGISMTVRLESVSDEIVPAPAGKGQQLQVSIRASVFGVAIPSKQMVLSGEGECTVGAKVTGEATPHEKRSLRTDALKDALSQAIEKAFGRLSEKPATLPKRKRRSG